MLFRSLPELLEQFYDEDHRCKLWLTVDADGPPPLALRAGRDWWALDDRYVPIFRETGLLPLARMVSVGRGFTVDGSLLSALADRWRPETHTFHFRWGELTVTLQDVSFLTGLPIRGVPLVPGPPSVDWKARLVQRFGQSLPEGARGVPRAWLRQFRKCPQGAPHEVVRTHLVAYLLQLFGWVLFPTTKGDFLNPSFIRVAESLVDA